MGSLPLKTESSTIDYDKEVLVVTCASGKQATALLPNIAHIWKHLRLVCHSQPSQEKLRQQYPSAEVIRADLQLLGEPERILRGATAIYHVEPPFAHRQAAIGFRMIDAAKKAAADGGLLKHFVYASVLNSQLRKVRPPTSSAIFCLYQATDQTCSKRCFTMTSVERWKNI